MKKVILSTLIQMAIVLGISLAAAGCVSLFHPHKPSLKLTAPTAPGDRWEITIDRVNSEFGGQVQWVDARTSTDFENGHAAGAIHVMGLDSLSPSATEVLFTTQVPIVVYCDGASCKKSRKVAGELRELMAKDVFYLKGGYEQIR